jgi:hypothetical protein
MIATAHFTFLAVRTDQSWSSAGNRIPVTEEAFFAEDPFSQPSVGPIFSKLKRRLDQGLLICFIDAPQIIFSISSNKIVTFCLISAPCVLFML